MGNEDFTYTNMHQILYYAADKIQTAYENNIKQHFLKYTDRFIDVCFEKQSILNTLRQEEKDKSIRDIKIKELFQTLWLIKKDVLNIDHNPIFDSKPQHYPFIQWCRKLALPISLPSPRKILFMI